MEQQENKYVTIGVTEIYEYTKLADKIAGSFDNCGGIKFKSGIGGGRFLRECTNCDMGKNNLLRNFS